MSARRVTRYQSMKEFQGGGAAAGDTDAPPGLQSTEMVPNPEHHGRGERGDGGTDDETTVEKMDACKEIESMLRNWRDKIHYSLQSSAVALTVLVSVTFTGLLNPPGGVTNEGKFNSSSSYGISIFILSDAFSFFLALGALTLVLSTTLPSPAEYKPTKQKIGRKNLETQRSTIKGLSLSLNQMGAILYFVNVCFLASLFLCAFAYIAAGRLLTVGHHGHTALQVVAFLGPGFTGGVMILHNSRLRESWPPPHFDLKLLDSILETEQKGPPAANEGAEGLA